MGGEGVAYIKSRSMSAGRYRFATLELESIVRSACLN